jgi:transposase
MPRALGSQLRLQIIQLHQQAYSPSAISEQLTVSLSSVRRFLRTYQADPLAELRPNYQGCGRNNSRQQTDLLRIGGWLKRLHPGWGAPLIRLHLQQRYSPRRIPNTRTLQRHFLKLGLNRPRQRVYQQRIGRSTAPHNIWQTDAKERLTLLNGLPACYLTLSDEDSGACLETLVFPL